jgi:hypothetical protein
LGEREGARSGDAWWEEKIDQICARYNPKGLLTFSAQEADAWGEEEKAFHEWLHESGIWWKERERDWKKRERERARRRRNRSVAQGGWATLADAESARCRIETDKEESQKKSCDDCRNLFGDKWAWEEWGLRCHISLGFSAS